jgi:hypothetical protein
MEADHVARAVQAWLAKRIPADWFLGQPEVLLDAEEILVIGTLPAPEEPGGTGAADDDADAELARVTRIKRFREETRQRRMRIAAEAEHRFGRRVSWGAACGDQRMLFTTLSVPVMTRLRMKERAVLDTLIEAGVARSRSDALAWCVRLVGTHQADWIRDLEAALVAVKKLRAEGPDPR